MQTLRQGRENGARGQEKQCGFASVDQVLCRFLVEISPCVLPL